MQYYTTGSSFQRVEDVHLIAAIKTLRPDDGLLPNRRQLATSLLDACHEDVKTKVAKGMIGATSCLIGDGWSNVNNDAIINYMVTSPEFALFLESVSTGQQGHDRKFIADDIECVITFVLLVLKNRSRGVTIDKLVLWVVLLGVLCHGLCVCV
jgi:hypothetical protein